MDDNIHHNKQQDAFENKQVDTQKLDKKGIRQAAKYTKEYFNAENSMQQKYGENIQEIKARNQKAREEKQSLSKSAAEDKANKDRALRESEKNRKAGNKKAAREEELKQQKTAAEHKKMQQDAAKKGNEMVEKEYGKMSSKTHRSNMSKGTRAKSKSNYTKKKKKIHNKFVPTNVKNKMDDYQNNKMASTSFIANETMAAINSTNDAYRNSKKMKGTTNENIMDKMNNDVQRGMSKEQALQNQQSKKTKRTTNTLSEKGGADFERIYKHNLRLQGNLANMLKHGLISEEDLNTYVLYFTPTPFVIYETFDLGFKLTPFDPSSKKKIGEEYTIKADELTEEIQAQIDNGTLKIEKNTATVPVGFAESEEDILSENQKMVEFKEFTFCEIDPETGKEKGKLTKLNYNEITDVMRDAVSNGTHALYQNSILISQKFLTPELRKQVMDESIKFSKDVHTKYVEEETNADKSEIIRELKSKKNKLMNVRYGKDKTSKNIYSVIDEDLAKTEKNIEVYINERNLNKKIVKTVEDYYLSKKLDKVDGFYLAKASSAYSKIVNRKELDFPSFKSFSKTKELKSLLEEDFKLKQDLLIEKDPTEKAKIENKINLLQQDLKTKLLDVLGSKYDKNANVLDLVSQKLIAETKENLSYIMLSISLQKQVENENDPKIKKEINSKLNKLNEKLDPALFILLGTQHNLNNTKRFNSAAGMFIKELCGQDASGDLIKETGLNVIKELGVLFDDKHPLDNKDFFSYAFKRNELQKGDEKLQRLKQQIEYTNTFKSFCTDFETLISGGDFIDLSDINNLLKHETLGKYFKNIDRNKIIAYSNTEEFQEQVNIAINARNRSKKLSGQNTDEDELNLINSQEFAAIMLFFKENKILSNESQKTSYAASFVNLLQVQEELSLYDQHTFRSYHKSIEFLNKIQTNVNTVLAFPNGTGSIFDEIDGLTILKLAEYRHKKMYPNNVLLNSALHCAEFKDHIHAHSLTYNYIEKHFDLAKTKTNMINEFNQKSYIKRLENQLEFEDGLDRMLKNFADIAEDIFKNDKKDIADKEVDFSLYSIMPMLQDFLDTFVEEHRSFELSYGNIRVPVDLAIDSIQKFVKDGLINEFMSKEVFNKEDLLKHLETIRATVMEEYEEKPRIYNKEFMTHSANEMFGSDFELINYTYMREFFEIPHIKEQYPKVDFLYTDLGEQKRYLTKQNYKRNVLNIVEAIRNNQDLDLESENNMVIFMDKINSLNFAKNAAGLNQQQLFDASIIAKQVEEQDKKLKDAEIEIQKIENRQEILKKLEEDLKEKINNGIGDINDNTKKLENIQNEIVNIEPTLNKKREILARLETNTVAMQEKINELAVQLQKGTNEVENIQKLRKEEELKLITTTVIVDDYNNSRKKRAESELTSLFPSDYIYIEDAFKKRRFETAQYNIETKIQDIKARVNTYITDNFPKFRKENRVNELARANKQVQDELQDLINNLKRISVEHYQRQAIENQLVKDDISFVEDYIKEIEIFKNSVDENKGKGIEGKTNKPENSIPTRSLQYLLDKAILLSNSNDAPELQQFMNELIGTTNGINTDIPFYQMLNKQEKQSVDMFERFIISNTGISYDYFKSNTLSVHLFKTLKEFDSVKNNLTDNNIRDLNVMIRQSIADCDKIRKYNNQINGRNNTPTI